MVNNLSKVISSNEFYYKCLRDGQVRLMIKSVESFRKIVHHLETAKINFHTFQIKQERAYRVVIKGLHHSTPVSDIKAILLSLGHQVRSVRNIISRVSKQPLPMFFVDLDPNANNKEIYNIRSFDNAIIQIEAPKKFDDIVQCFRCQDFGHTKSYCRREFRCLKCGLGHPTAECTKTQSTPPKCVHCLSNHTANYRGCRIYQNLLSKRTPRVNINNNEQVIHKYTHNTQSINQGNIIPPVQDSNTWTYAQAVRGDNTGVSNVMEKIEAMLAKQIELINTLTNMMSTLINKLCK